VAHEVKSMTYDPLGEGSVWRRDAAYAGWGGASGTLSLSVWLVVLGPAPPSLSLACTPHLLFNGLIKSYFTAGRSCQMTWGTGALFLSGQADCIIQMDTVELLKITSGKQTENIGCIIQRCIHYRSSKSSSIFHKRDLHSQCMFNSGQFQQYSTQTQNTSNRCMLMELFEIIFNYRFYPVEQQTKRFAIIKQKKINRVKYQKVVWY
jgi:hypothetical protein